MRYLLLGYSHFDLANAYVCPRIDQYTPVSKVKFLAEASRVISDPHFALAISTQYADALSEDLEAGTGLQLSPTSLSTSRLCMIIAR